jgi:type VI secretion system Hcp family effector
MPACTARAGEARPGGSGMAKRAYSGYMKIESPNIQGECGEIEHKDWIEIFGYEFGCHYAADEHVLGMHGGATIGKPHPSDFRIKKYVDRSSPTLQMVCCTGERIETITIEIVRPVGQMQVFYQWVLKHSYISHYAHVWSGHSEDEEVLPIEEVAFLIGEAKWAYTSFDPETSTPTGTVSHSFNFHERTRT